MISGSSRRTDVTVFCGSARSFFAYILDDLRTAGQGSSQKVYYEMKEGLMVSSDVRRKDKPHVPSRELLFMYVLLALFTLLFWCSFLCMPGSLRLEGADCALSGIFFACVLFTGALLGMRERRAF